MRRPAWSAFGLLLLALAREAKAQTPPDTSTGPRVYYPLPRVKVYTSLRYERRPGAEVCPGEATFGAALAAHLGHDAFEPDAEGIAAGDVHVVVTKVPGGFEARYEWTGSRDVGRPVGSFREPGYSRRDCHDLLKAVALDLSSAFLILEIKYGEKLARQRQAPPCPSTEPATTPPSIDSRFSVWPTEWPLPPLAKPKPEPPKRPERLPIAIRVGGTVSSELIAVGWGSLGLSADVGVRYRAFSASVEAHGDPPLGSTTFRGGSTMSLARLSGALLLCAHWGWFAGCGVGDVGRFLFPERPQDLPASTFYGAVGVRAGLEFPVAPPRFFLRAGLDVRAPVRAVNLIRGVSTVFQAAGPGVGFGLGFIAELPP